MLRINSQLGIPDHEIQITPIRAQGPGGQNVNKVSSAVHLRFDIHASSLPMEYKRRLLELQDRRISKDGIIVIKANEHRTLQKNTQSACDRLAELIRSLTITRKKRIATRPSRNAQRKRLDSKRKRGQVKAMRGKISE